MALTAELSAPLQPKYSASLTACSDRQAQRLLVLCTSQCCEHAGQAHLSKMVPQHDADKVQQGRLQPIRMYTLSATNLPAIEIKHDH